MTMVPVCLPSLQQVPHATTYAIPFRRLQPSRAHVNREHESSMSKHWWLRSMIAMWQGNNMKLNTLVDDIVG